MTHEPTMLCNAVECAPRSCAVHNFVDTRMQKALGSLGKLEAIAKLPKKSRVKAIPRKEIPMDGKTIQAIRQKYKLTRQQFSRLLGVDATTVHRWERGITLPSHSARVKIMRVRNMGIRRVKSLLEITLK